MSAPKPCYTRDGNTKYDGSITPVDQQKHFRYGTAGFRYPNEEMTFIAFRLGFLAALRARSLNKVVGVMITASHNPSSDNGVKVIEPNGHMLESSWEDLATELINSPDSQFEHVALDVESRTVTQLKDRDIKHCSANAKLLIGCDTRDSSPKLMEAIRAGAEYGSLKNVEFFGKQIYLKGLVVDKFTTPQLHYLVYLMNQGTYIDKFDPVTETCQGFLRFTEGLPELPKKPKNYNPMVVVDCANGVGAKWVLEYLKHPAPDQNAANPLYIVLKNDARGASPNEYLNHECGADFVKISGKPPRGFELIDPMTRCASLDGDADRLVYFYKDRKQKLHLLDGDKIAALFATFLVHELTELNIHELSIGVIQTAYANGNSTRFFKNLGIVPETVATGVKNLHPKAETYDIGIYFEANGHGTVTFSERFWSFVRDVHFKDLTETPVPEPHAKQLLRNFAQIINPIVGDGIADLYAVEAILRYFDWSLEDWEKNTYTDIPSAQLKIPFKDRQIFQTTPDETRLIRPEEMQREIDQLVAQFPSGARAFVRPSGTEPIVRVYAEANSEDDALRLAYRVARVIDPTYSDPFGFGQEPDMKPQV